MAESSVVLQSQAVHGHVNSQFEMLLVPYVLTIEESSLNLIDFVKLCPDLGIHPLDLLLALGFLRSTDSLELFSFCGFHLGDGIEGFLELIKFSSLTLLLSQASGCILPGAPFDLIKLPLSTATGPPHLTANITKLGATSASHVSASVRVLDYCLALIAAFPAFLVRQRLDKLRIPVLYTLDIVGMCQLAAIDAGQMPL